MRLFAALALRAARVAAVGALAPAIAGLAGSAGTAAGADAPPRRYAVARLSGASAAPVIDGDLADAAWARADWSAPYVDIEGEGVRPPPLFATRFKALWSAEALYIAAALEEPRLFATLTEHDAVIFHDPDFELFVDPEGDGLGYFELEVNVLGATWDLRLDRPYWQGGRADNSWELAGMRIAVALDGTLNDPRDIDQGWTVELALPWAAFAVPAPRPGESWRINFSRVEWPLEIRAGRLEKVAGACEENWVWSPQGRIDMHRPERWGFFDFRP